MLFASFLGVIESVARLNENATIGNVQKMNSHLTRGQVERCLKQLEIEGYMHHKIEHYGRTGKKVWYLSGRCSTNMSIVNRAIDDAGYLNGSYEVAVK